MKALWLAATLLASGRSAPSVPLLQKVAAETALAQAQAVAPAWETKQRDCAGLVRFAWREAYRQLSPERLQRPLFRDQHGVPSDFADARTLVESNLTWLGRGAQAQQTLQSGDVLAFRQERPEGEVWHLMLVVLPPDGARSQASVVYHPGEKDDAVRVGRLTQLALEAPREWQPVPGNSAFLGFYRFKEWTR